MEIAFCLIACQLTIKHAVFPHFGNAGKKSPLEQPVCGDVIVQSSDVECGVGYAGWPTLYNTPLKAHLHLQFSLRF